MNREPITLTTAIKMRNVHELNETGKLNDRQLNIISNQGD